MIQNHCVSIKQATVLFFSSFLLAACGEPQPRTSVREKGRLTVVMDEPLPGYFVFGGESYGYQYDLFKAFDYHLGVELQVVRSERPSEYDAMLADGRADIVTALSDHAAEIASASAIPIYHTSYVLLAGKRKADEIRKKKRFELIPCIREGKVLISSGFKSTRAYSMLLDSLSRTAEVYVSSRNSFELIGALGDGRYDYLICEMSEAQLGCAFQKNVAQIYRFAEPVALSAVVSPQDTSLRSDFEAWLSHFRNSGEYAMLNYLYFEKGIVRQMLGRGLSAARGGGISVYDELFKEVCEREGYDWRLMSAIAYSESRFNPMLVSSKGACGLMQVMPRVARQLGFKGSVMDPASNILLAAKVLGKIEKSLDFGPSASEMDRLRIVLACYNGGIGHVIDARNLARKYGGDPDSWTDVSHYLTLKSDPAYAEDEIVRHGRFECRTIRVSGCGYGERRARSGCGALALRPGRVRAGRGGIFFPVRAAGGVRRCLLRSSCPDCRSACGSLEISGLATPSPFPFRRRTSKALRRRRLLPRCCRAWPESGSSR